MKIQKKKSFSKVLKNKVFQVLFEMKNKGRMQIFEKKRVVSGPRDYQENVRRSRKCRVDLIFYVSRHKK